MIASRGAQIFKASKLLASASGNFKPAVRNGHHHWNYRTVNTDVNKTLLYGAQAIMGFAWWWILWHIYTEPGHVFGEFEYPISSEWTDAELGIPDDE